MNDQGGPIERANRGPTRQLSGLPKDELAHPLRDSDEEPEPTEVALAGT